MTSLSSNLEQDESEGLRILARIIARSWAKRHLAEATLEVQPGAMAKDVKLPVAAEPALTP